MAKGKHITQKDLDQIKTLRDANLSMHQISKVLSRGIGTVQKAEQCGFEIEAYKENTKIANKKYANKNGQVVVEEENKLEKPVLPVASNDKIVAQLREMNVNLNRLVRAWSLKPEEKKKRWL